MTDWRVLDSGRELTLARRDTYFAAQVPSALGATLLAAPADSSHTCLHWEAGHGALVGQPVQGVRAGLDLAGLRWLLLRGEQVIATQRARGLTLANGLSWLRHAASEAGLPDRDLKPDGYQLPADALATGALGISQEPDRVALAGWFHDADLLLEQVRAAHPAAGPVRVWPHHFDIATLLDLGQGQGQGQDEIGPRSVGVGMSPGDQAIPQPYFYVSPWPVPARRQGPDLPRGRWHTQGWFGALLKAQEVPLSDTETALSSFLDAAIAGARELALAEGVAGG